MMVAGIGCRRGATAQDVRAAIDAALARHALELSVLAAVATSAAKGGESGIVAAAAALGVRLVLVPQAELEAASAQTVTRSERVRAHTGVPSLAEAAALAAAGRAGRLVGPRTVVGPATCALATAGGEP